MFRVPYTLYFAMIMKRIDITHLYKKEKRETEIKSELFANLAIR